MLRFVLGSIGFSLGYIFGLIPSKPREVSRCQLKRFLNRPELTPFVFAHVGRTFFEALAPYPNNAIFDAPNFDSVSSLLSRGKGLLVLTAHFGQWDLLGAYSVKRGIPLYAIGRPARRLQWLLEWIREKHGIKTIWRVGKGGARQIEELLSKGNVVAALIDQDTRVKSIPVDFFGVNASTPVTAVRIALSQGIPIASAFIRREKQRFVVDTREITGALPEDVLLEFNKRLEDQIRLAPEQWVWFHQRWRTNSEGIRVSFDDYIKFLRS
jgi:KDO2-lipid IV(A) lauroyltransferase